ncbi:DUF6993 domain-containing protein [uncultured Arthrobacter sp.]|uniref:DUF6993 domain-containing protein n=1 Tax=uncultured Arthrobacter sp. TaxID=114050 RepID=UPI0032165A54
MTSRDPAPLRRTCGLRFSGRVTVGLAAAALTVALGTAACSAPAPTVTSSPAVSTGSTSSIPAAGGQPTGSASPGVTGAAPAPSGLSGAVEAALQSLLASTPQPSTAQVREILSAAGFAPAAVEVSASRTPTGLAADAVEVGVLGESECVMAQIRSGTVESSVLPVLPNGRCFIGSVQR